MSYNDAFFEKLPKEPTLALKAICAEFLNSSATSLQDHLEALGLMQSFCEANDIELKFPIVTKASKETRDSIWSFFYHLNEEVQGKANQITVEMAKQQFSAKFTNLFAYDFSEGDLAKLQSLINKLRKQIQEVKGLDAGHRKRLLKKLELLQSELHKRISDMDHFWGLVGEAGVIMGKLGEQAKPIIECVKLIADIVWVTQARAESLPSTAPNVLQLNSGENKK